MTSELTNQIPFVLYHVESDGSGKPAFIYIGTDKAMAFDNLMGFDGYYDANSLHVEYQSEYSEVEKK